MPDRLEPEKHLLDTERGILTLHTGDDWPYTVPINHAYTERILAFHCAPNGKRVSLIRRDARVQYNALQVHSLHPCYAIGADNDSGASMR